MYSKIRWIFTVLVFTGLQISGCQQDATTHNKIEPAHVEHIEGSELSRVTLTEKAIERIGLELDVVDKIFVKSSKAGWRLVVPYSAILYDAHGIEWVYTSPEPKLFVRQRIEVDFIKGDQAFLNKGPAVGTKVVKVGAAELFGTELEIGH